MFERARGGEGFSVNGVGGVGPEDRWLGSRTALGGELGRCGRGVRRPTKSGGRSFKRLEKVQVQDYRGLDSALGSVLLRLGHLGTLRKACGLLIMESIFVKVKAMFLLGGGGAPALPT